MSIEIILQPRGTGENVVQIELKVHTTGKYRGVKTLSLGNKARKEGRQRKKTKVISEKSDKKSSTGRIEKERCAG